MKFNSFLKKMQRKLPDYICYDRPVTGYNKYNKYNKIMEF